MLLTVDDDPSVSRAVARDLRRHYGSEFRIVRADSGPEALEALREILRRGERVAVILADYRMPVMNGIDFLEQAMDLFPRARRVLLTAYADTEAAIDAINVVDVDHYLLKPWQPPEEKLYPVIDELIGSWRASRELSHTETKVLGHRWSNRSYEVRDFLARNQVPYRWYFVDEPDGARLLAAAGLEASAIPVVLTPDGRVWSKPELTELAAAVGLQTSPSAELYDVIIVGGGPAGLGSAVYGASEGLKTMLIERQATGGQAGQSSRIENYLGFPDGISGAALTDRARRQALRFGTEILTAQTVTDIEVSGPTRVLTLSDGSRVAAKTVVLASGVSYRRLEAIGVDDLVGRGVYYGSASTEAEACADQHVVVVGGANSAGQAAVFFSRHASRVTIAVRGPSLAASMSSYLIDQIEAIETIEVKTCTTVVECRGTEHLDEVGLLDSNNGQTTAVPASHVFVFIGALPMTDWLPEQMQRDRRGFVLTGPDLLHSGERPPDWTLDRDPYLLETSVPGIFVAGDVRAASVKRVASAVGEGALAISLVHEFLARH